VKFLVSYAQTTWRYGLFRLNRIVQGRSPWVQWLLLAPMTDVFAGDPGGRIVLYERRDGLGDIAKLASLPCTKPFGMDYVEGEGLYYLTGLICSEDGVPGDERIVRRNPEGEIDLEIRSPLFSLPRTLQRTENGLLVAVSGIDALLEIDLTGNVLWSWWATDRGYDILKSGRRRELKKGIDHRLKCYPSHDQTTHLNSAIVDPHDPTKVLAVLFYQGSVIRIDKQTLSHEVVITGLNGPHNVRGIPEGYMVSDTRNGVVKICDRDFNLTGEVYGSNRRVPRVIRWTQDAVSTPFGTYLIADGNRFRILEVDEQGNEVAFKFGMPNRVFQMQIVPDTFTL
jgi:hypothetical protein